MSASGAGRELDDRVRRLLTSAGADPGAPESWDQFIVRARRARLTYRFFVAGAVAAVVLLGALGATTLGERLPDRREPKPAESPSEDVEEERTEDAEDDARDAERRLRGGPGIAIGGKQPEGGLPGSTAPRGDGEDGVGRGPRSVVDPPKEGAAPAGAKCRGAPATIVGTEGDDRLTGTYGRDVISTLGGDDEVTALKGEDWVCGGDGDDVLIGGLGGDSLLGGDGHDVMDGQDGWDTLFYVGGSGGVTVDLASGTATGHGSDTVAGIEAVDATRFADSLTGTEGQNFFFSNAGNDTLAGGGGDDLLYSGTGDDDVRGDAGADQIGFSTGAFPGQPGVEVDLAGNRAVGDHGIDTLAGIEEAVGTRGNDVLSGDSADNALYGSAGDDTISGAGGDDRLLGGENDDRLEGGSGTDYLDGGPGIDACVGGEDGQDCEASAATAALVVAGAVSLLRARRLRARRRRR